MQPCYTSPEVEKLHQGVMTHIQAYVDKQNSHVESLYRIGAALSSETNLERLLEMILREAQSFTNADGGTLYIATDDEKALRFTVINTTSLNIRMGDAGHPITWPDIPLYQADGSPNLEHVAAVCAIENRVINIPDVYTAKDYNFEGTRKFDAKNGFRSRSMLVIPMRNHDNEVIGVCQLINRLDPITGEVIAFSDADERSLLSLASQAAVAMTNTRLIRDLRLLLESLIKSIACAIDEKSPYTGGHVQKVAQLAMIIANAINEDEDGPYRDTHFSEDDLDQIHIAGLVHDVGKITTPEYVMDKSTKLQTIHDRIETVRTRFELYVRELELELARQQLRLLEEGRPRSELDALKTEYQGRIAQAREDLAFVEHANLGSEFMNDESIARIERIASLNLSFNGETIPLLNANEVENLSVRKGTLTMAERAKINHHAFMSTQMLEALPFPKKLRRVPEIAGGHHEKLNGKGYPKGLTAEQLTLEARIMALADIFEALTAADRPYKRPNTLSEAMRIIDFMVKDYELDPDLVKFFYDRNLHILFAKLSLLPEQLDIGV
jgi:HD-GYP domain-containing protein (c-di-GMP phosphodiesterase class II)